MIVLQVTLSYAEDPDEIIPIMPTMVYLIDQAYHTAPVTFEILADILNPDPPSAITDIEVLWTEGSGEVDQPVTSGTQIIDFDGDISAGSDATDLADDTTEYTATVTVDGTEYPITVVGSAAQTITTLIAEILDDVSGVDLEISSGNLLFTSQSEGVNSSVLVTDGDLFAAITNFVSIPEPTVGTDATYLDTVSMNFEDSAPEFASDFAALEGDLYNMYAHGRPAAYTLS